MSTPEPTLAQMQFKLSYLQADEQLRHLEDSLSPASPRRTELNVLRRQFAGIIHRLHNDLESQREQVIVAKGPSHPPKKAGWKHHARCALVVVGGMVVLCALVFASVTAGAAVVLAAVVP